jgi:hypothetical protein
MRSNNPLNNLVNIHLNSSRISIRFAGGANSTQPRVSQLATRRAVPFAPTLRDATPDAHAGDKRARIAATYG